MLPTVIPKLLSLLLFSLLLEKVVARNRNPMTVLKGELEAMPMSAIRKKVQAAKIDEKLIDAADDSKASLIGLLIVLGSAWTFFWIAGMTK